jgi:hypothetical protein
MDTESEDGFDHDEDNVDRYGHEESEGKIGYPMTVIVRVVVIMIV